MAANEGGAAVMTLGSLFDGIGGWLLAAKHAGIKPVWASEIEPFPQAVTAYHFPGVAQLGDITKLDGAELPPVDIITAGSPCQDLSVAGKREGLDGARSGLFLRAIRLVHDMRRATGGRYPRFFVWENVPGAFSSNKGMDFQSVLEEIGEAEISIPPGGRWATAGLAELPKCEIAWRTLDAQYFGVPQRRRRIFLVADFGTERRCAGEILFERESVRGDSSESRKAGEETATGTKSGAETASIIRERAGCTGGGKGPLVSREKSLTLATNNDQTLYAPSGCLTPWDVQSNRIQSPDGKAAALYGGAGQGTHNGAVYIPDKARSLTARADGSPCIDRGPNIIAAGFNGAQGGNAGGLGYEVEKSATLKANACGVEPTVAVYDMTHADEVMRPVNGDRAPTLNARMGTGGNQVPVIGFLPQRKAESMAPMLELSLCLTNGTNPGWQTAVCTISSSDEQHLASGNNVTGCIMANCATKQWLGNQEAFSGDYHVIRKKSIRRLTPTECERLQGLPDGYTAIDGASDTARYKALGNGMAQPCADFVLVRLAKAVV